MKKLIFLFLLFLLLVPLTAVWAQGPVAFDFPEAETGNITEYIDSFYKTAVAIAGIAAVAMIVVGAIYFVVSGGSQDKQREGKDIITSAVWGVVLLLGAYIILNTVNPELVTLSPPRGELLTKYSCEEYPDIRVCEIGERPIEVEDPPDPDAVPQCCVLGLGHDGSAEPIISCSQDVTESCETFLVTDEDGKKIRIPKSCDETNKWSCEEVTRVIKSGGAYTMWAYYPKDGDAGAVADLHTTGAVGFPVPKPDEVGAACIVYAYKKEADDDWTNVIIPPELKDCPGFTR